MAEQDIRYSNRLGIALANITKTTALTSGILEDATNVIAKEGCHALDTHRVGIWRMANNYATLNSIASYNIVTGKHNVQEDFPLDDRLSYVRLLTTERLIVINNARNTTVLPNLTATYGPEICSLLDAPIRIGGKLVGVVCIEQDKCSAYPEQRVWTLEEQNFASSLADFVALAMESSERRILMRRTEALMSNLPGMVYQCLNDPPQFTFTFVSEGCRSLLGYAPAELMGNNAIKFFDMVHPDDVAPLERLNTETLSIGLPLETTFRMIMKDGTVKWIWERSRVVEKNVDGTPRLLEGFYTDITEQRRLEASELANRAKSEFLANMSHEIRTPMNAVMGMAEIALRSFPDPAVIEHINNIKSAATGLLSIINDILDFSKIEAGAINLYPEKYNVLSLINDITTMISVRIGNKPLDFIVDDDPSMPREFIGDMTRVKQIAVNLLTNAVKFTKEGHIVFKISAEPMTDSDKYLLKMSVTDTGIGIRREDLSVLFSNFSQLDTRKNRGIEGTGLGLAISKQLVDRMNGEIQVQSTYGEGSCFSFFIEQGICTMQPAISPMDSGYKAGILFSNANKMQVTCDKLKTIGVTCVSIGDVSELDDTYTHLFFDSNKCEQVCVSASKDTRLFAVAVYPSHIQDIPSRVTPVYTPLTSLTLFQLFGCLAPDKSGTDTNCGNELKVSGAHFLVVDDLEINLIIAENILLSYGAEVSLASSGLEALEMVKQTDFDIVFMDHMMPDVDGVDTTKLIRALPQNKFKKLPIVALTANVVGDVRDMFMENGMSDFLSKPLETNEIERVLRKWLPHEKWEMTNVKNKEGRKYLTLDSSC